MSEAIYGPPHFEGIAESITIKQIIAVYNPKLWKKYQKVKNYLRKLKLGNPLKDIIKWHSKDDENLKNIENKLEPVIDKSVGECWLFHGTHKSNTKSIIQNGFTTKYTEKKLLTGYGALGRGAYFSDSFAKVSQYIPCPECQKNECSCPNQYKTAILSRVLLGRPYPDPDPKWKDVFSLSPPKGYNSRYGPCTRFGDYSNKGFTSNEFCVPSSPQTEEVNHVYPEFLILYIENNKKSTLPIPLNANTCFATLEQWNQMKQENFTTLLSHKDMLQSVEKSIEDYTNILKVDGENLQKRIEFLEGPLKASLFEFISRFSSLSKATPVEKKCVRQIKEAWKRERTKLSDELWEILNPIYLKREKTLSNELKVNSYFYFYTNGPHKWSQSIKYLNELILKNKSPHYFLMRAHAYFMLGDKDQYVANTAHVFFSEFQSKLDDKCFFYEKEKFFQSSLELLCSEENFKIEFHASQNYYESWLREIADWLAQKSEIKFEDWQFYYWSLYDWKQREIFAKAISNVEMLSLNSLGHKNFVSSKKEGNVK